MGRSPGGSQSQDGFNKGAWTPLEDKILTDYVKVNGEGKWSNLARKTGLKRCGKSCRLRWMNYLRPDIKRGNISDDEEELILRLHKLLGNRWSLIAGRLPGRTDNEIKNYWNTTVSKKKVDISFALLKPKISTSCTDNDLLKFGTDHKFTSADETVFVETATHCSDQNVNGTIHTSIIEAAEANVNGMKIDPEIGDIDRLSSLSSVENGEDFTIDFNVEDICKFLGTDMMHDNKEGDGDRDGGEGSMFLEEVGDAASSDDLLSLASSFLGSDEGWPEEGHDLNINVSNINIIN